LHVTEGAIVAAVGTVVVTGAASGIGAACAQLLRASGHAVAGLDLRAPAAVDLPLAVDVVDAAGVEEAVAEAERRLGPLVGAITAAGYYERVPLGEIGEERWRRMLAVHLDGTANVCRSVYRRLRARGTGAICTVASELALCGDGDAVHYATAKGGVIAFTKALALEAAPAGVRVNCVAPGPTDTPLMTPELRDPAYVSSLVLGRLVRPEEIAETARFLLLEETNMVGQVVSPNAGAVM
jgi:NAD(P)-dependent dehydrogenase (short-subunit alcohol dehydrogenase family)